MAHRGADARREDTRRIEVRRCHRIRTVSSWGWVITSAPHAGARLRLLTAVSPGGAKPSFYVARSCPFSGAKPADPEEAGPNRERKATPLLKPITILEGADFGPFHRSHGHPRRVISDREVAGLSGLVRCCPATTVGVRSRPGSGHQVSAGRSVVSGPLPCVRPPDGGSCNSDMTGRG